MRSYPTGTGATSRTAPFRDNDITDGAGAAPRAGGGTRRAHPLEAPLAAGGLERGRRRAVALPDSGLLAGSPGGPPSPRGSGARPAGVRLPTRPPLWWRRRRQRQRLHTGGPLGTLPVGGGPAPRGACLCARGLLLPAAAVRVSGGVWFF